MSRKDPKNAQMTKFRLVKSFCFIKHKSYGALQSTIALCALRSIINFKSEMIDQNRSF
jgi:hypothetical protein